MIRADTHFLQDKDKLDFNQYDIFDRIINVKITARNLEESDANVATDVFVIRSDYEIFYPSQEVSSFATGKTPSSFGVRKCIYKPSINLDYQMYTGSVGGNIDLYISNFYVFTADGQCLRNFNSSKYKILKVEILMGYFGQFKGTVDIKEKNSKKIYEQFFDFTPANGMDKITISGDVLTVTTDKLPPDYTLKIHGYVGNILSAPIGEADTTDSATSETKAQIKSSNDSPIAKVLFEEITRRFYKVGYVEAGKELLASDLLSIATKDEDLVKAGIKAVDNGKMSTIDAKKYGVQVVTSDGVDALNFDPLVDSDGNEVETRTYFVSGSTVGATLNRILSYVSVALNYAVTKDGTILVFTKKEALDTSSLSDQWEKKGIYKKSVSSIHYDNKLPAVYNINIDALSTIVCPFYFFIEPFQQLEFRTAYALTNNTAYFAGFDTSIYLFRVIKVNISFATVENRNEVTIVASNQTDIRGVQ